MTHDTRRQDAPYRDSSPGSSLTLGLTSWDDGCLSRFTIDAPTVDLTACYVYVAWGEDRSCPLYVGKSREPVGRIGRHLREAVWTYEVVSFDFYAFTDETAALYAEGRAIFELNPIHNIMRGSPGQREGKKRRSRRVNPYPVVAFPRPIKGISDDQLAIVAQVQNRRGKSW